MDFREKMVKKDPQVIKEDQADLELYHTDTLLQVIKRRRTDLLKDENQLENFHLTGLHP